MAQMSKQVLGRISGSIGDVTFRQRGGKNFAAPRPNSFIPGTDEASILRRARFALAVKLAKAINSIDNLKTLWLKKSPAGTSVFNYMVKLTYKFVDSKSLNDFAMLTPTLGFRATAATTVDANALTVNLDAIGSDKGIDTAVEKNIVIASVLLLSNPVDDTVEQNLLMSFQSPEQALDIANPLSFNISLTDQQAQAFSKYQDHKAAFVAVTLDDQENPVNHSNTFLN